MLWAIVFWQGMTGCDQAELAMAWDERAKNILRSSLQKSGYIVRDVHVDCIASAEEYRDAIRVGVIT